MIFGSRTNKLGKCSSSSLSISSLSISSLSILGLCVCIYVG